MPTETGPGVFEVAILFSEALEAADRGLLFKSAAKEIGARFGIMPSFMAKWSAQYPGCSGHCHQSLSDGKKNLFYDSKGRHAMSKLFESYLAGQLKYLLELAPKARSRFLIAGKAWVDASDYGVVRLSGQYAASMSVLVGAPHLDEDYLVLSTIHSAKGLEWDGVHVLAIYDGNFPACMSAGSKESIDEERRLLYVAVTRARRQLHLYVPVRYYHRPQGIDDAHGYGKPSRFLTSEVQQTCEVLRLDDPVLSASVLRSGPLRKITVSVDSLFS